MLSFFWYVGMSVDFCDLRVGMIWRVVIFGLIFFSGEALAQLSSNPWVIANDTDEVKKVYEKRDKRFKGGVQQYEAEGSVVIDRSHAYIDAEAFEDKGDEGILDKVSGMFDKGEGKVVPNTSANRQRLAARREQAEEESGSGGSGGGLLPDFSGLKNIGNLGKNFSLPKINATGMIKKFEKASGIDFKAIGRKLK